MCSLCRALCSTTAKHFHNLRSIADSSNVASSTQRSLVFSMPYYWGTPSREQQKESVFLHSTSESKAKDKNRPYQRHAFSDDAALAAHSEGQVQSLMICFYKSMRSLQPNYDPEEDPMHMPRNCNTIEHHQHLLAEISYHRITPSFSWLR